VVKVRSFCLCSEGCLLFCLAFWLCWMVFCGAFQHGLWCASMLPSVKFAYVGGSARKRISKEEGAISLIPSSTMLRVHIWLRLCGHRRQSVPGDINKFEHCSLGSVRVSVWCSGFCLRRFFVTVYVGFVNGGVVERVSVSDATNFGLETVIITSWMLESGA